jgi:hypothetical protein
LTEALSVALAGAACRGTAIPGDKPATLLNAALQEENQPRADVEIRSTLWVRLDQAHAEQRAGLVREIRNALGASQDLGAVLTVDAVRALRLIKAAARSWSLAASDARPSWSLQAAKTLSPLEAAVDDQIERLRTLVHEIRQRLPRGTSYADTIKTVQQAIDVGEHRGFVRHDDVPGLKQRNASAATSSSSRDLETFENDLAALADDATYEQRLAVAARDRGAGLATMRTFLLENERWIDESLAAAEAQTPDQDAVDLVARVNTVITQWQTLAEGTH